MSNPTPKDPAAKAMTAADAAKLVRRPVTEVVDAKGEDGQPTKATRTRLVAIKVDEVLAFADNGTHVVVVTRDGQKFSSADLATSAD